MAILDNASSSELQELLELFSQKRLKSYFDVRGTKGNVAVDVAHEGNLQEIKTFVVDNVGGCKQHIYVLETRHSRSKLIDEMPNVEILQEGRHTQIGLLRQKVEYIIYDPAERASARQIWPFTAEQRTGLTILKFVIMESSPAGSAADGKVLTRVPDEDSIMQMLGKAGFMPLDLHAGLKALWGRDMIDSIRVRYKTANSTDASAMDAGKSVKKSNLARYKEIIRCPILESTFTTVEQNPRSQIIFRIRPGDGFIGLNRYTEDAEREIDILEEILDQNG